MRLPLFAALATLLLIQSPLHANSKHAKKSAPHATENHDKSHWTYEGETGPAKWSELKPEFGLCGTGKQQSPININEAYNQELDTLQFQYSDSKANIQNNGHTIQLNYDPGSYLVIGNDKYQLLQFHFHTPSEEAIGGQRYPMVAHLVHKNEVGQLAVVALLMNQGDSDNPVIERLWNKMPRNHNETRTYDEIRFNAADLLPNNKSYWTFMGSLTTPPCSEGVRWLVLKNPLYVSSKQIAQFRHEFPMNARPLQNLFQRAILDGN